jgi:hypothetical protein
MASAKVRDLKVRPIQSVDLCFEVSGVIGEQNTTLAALGAPVTAFDLAAFYAGLGVEANTADPGHLKYDSQHIHDDPAIQAALLFGLRAESIKAVLDKAIAGRENSFYQKFKNQAAVIAQTQALYSPGTTNPNSKPSRLDTLAKISQQQHDALSAAYVATSRTGVVQVTTSDMTSSGTSTGTSDATNSGTTTGKNTNASTQSTTNSSDMSVPPSAASKQHTAGSGAANTSGSGTSDQTTTGAGKTTTSGSSKQTQHTDNTDYDYRHPSLENEAQYQRAQVSLIDEQYSQFMYGQNLPLLDRVFTNESKAIDLDVKRLQVAYLNTLLLSPIDGVITGLFKNLGDCVSAGQPVLRVENDVEVLLVGTVIFRGLVSIGSNVTLTTQIFDSPTALTISGKVVAVRGHKAEDDRWDLLIRCPNRDAHNNPILPINYNFDFDDTTVDIS